MGGKPANRGRTGSALTVVRPFQRVSTGQGHAMALLPLGHQNYVLAPQDCFAGALRDAFRYRGDRLVPDSISVNVFAAFDDRFRLAPGVLLGGAWRTASGEAPSRIAVHTAGRRREAAMLRLPGRPAWGTYYLDLGEGSLGDLTVTAYDGAGSVLASVELEPERETEEAGGPFYLVD